MEIVDGTAMEKVCSERRRVLFVLVRTDSNENGGLGLGIEVRGSMHS